MLLTGFDSFCQNSHEVHQMLCARHSQQRLFRRWRHSVQSRVADWMHGPCLATIRRRLHLKGWLSEQQWHTKYQTHRWEAPYLLTCAGSYHTIFAPILQGVMKRRCKWCNDAVSCLAYDIVVDWTICDAAEQLQDNLKQPGPSCLGYACGCTSIEASDIHTHPPFEVICRLLLASWAGLSRSIVLPKKHRQRRLLQQAFSAMQAATAAQVAQLGHFWQRWQVHFPQQHAMMGWRAVRVATARQRAKEAWGLQARRCLLQRRAFVAWKAVVAVQYSQACKLQVTRPISHTKLMSICCLMCCVGFACASNMHI